MERSPSFQFYAKDWRDVKVRRMSLAAQGAYMAILADMWVDSKDQCSILDHNGFLAKALGISEADWLQLRGEIQHPDDPLLEEKDGRLFSRRLRSEASKQAKYAKTQKESGRRGAEKRWGNRHSDPIGDPNGDPIGDPNGEPMATGMAKNSSSSSSSSSSSLIPSSLVSLTPVPDGNLRSGMVGGLGGDSETPPDKPSATRPPARKFQPASDEDWLKELEADDLYRGIDIRIQLKLCIRHFKDQGLQVSRQRFINWLGKEVRYQAARRPLALPSDPPAPSGCPYVPAITYGRGKPKRCGLPGDPYCPEHRPKPKGTTA